MVNQASDNHTAFVKYNIIYIYIYIYHIYDIYIYIYIYIYSDVCMHVSYEYIFKVVVIFVCVINNWSYFGCSVVCANKGKECRFPATNPK